jgi:peptidoglycan hydrolase CwlO-like protein
MFIDANKKILESRQEQAASIRLRQEAEAKISALDGHKEELKRLIAEFNEKTGEKKP